MPSLRLYLPDLCDSDDEIRLERAYVGADGVYGAVARRGDRCIDIDFEDDEITPASLIEIAQDAGFDAHLAS
ncbi:MAG: hypothetical protein ACREM1_05495 [Longimicrobiales bacterium]